MFTVDLVQAVFWVSHISENVLARVGTITVHSGPLPLQTMFWVSKYQKKFCQELGHCLSTVDSTSVQETKSDAIVLIYLPN